jgi:hypothetical protein
VASVDSNDDTIFSSGLDPMVAVQDALDFFQMEIDEGFGLGLGLGNIQND